MAAALFEAGGFAATYLTSVAEVLQGNERIGLGFFVAPRVIATCAHVVEDAGANLRVRAFGTTREVRLMFEEAARDVAFLQLDTPADGWVVQPLEIDEGPHQGASVQLVGWDAGRDTALLHTSRVEGTLAGALPGTGMRADLYQIAGDVRPGYSGGPAVLEGTRRVCGMVVARDQDQGVGMLVPGASLLDCYRKLVARTGNEGPAVTTPAAPVAGQRPLPLPPGGRYRTEHHIARPWVNQLVLQLFENGDPIVLCAPTMSGKTWWLNHLLPSFEERLGRTGRVVTLLSFGKNDSLKAILLSLVSAVVRGIRGDARAARAAWDDALLEPDTATNCLEEYFFDAGSHEALLVLDLEDAFWDNPCQRDFFSLLRHWSQRGGAWQRLRLLVAYSTTPSVWLANPADSPFAVDPVLITDWSPAEVEQAASMHGFADRSPEVVARLMRHTGGHPYFVRSVLHDARTSHPTLEAAVARLDSDPGPLRVPLGRMFQRCGLHEDAGLRSAVLDVADRRATQLDYKHYRRLADAGLVVGTAARPDLRVPIAARLLRGE
jgi:hypothetical protein